MPETPLIDRASQTPPSTLYGDPNNPATHATTGWAALESGDTAHRSNFRASALGHYRSPQNTSCSLSADVALPLLDVETRSTRAVVSHIWHNYWHTGLAEFGPYHGTALALSAAIICCLWPVCLPCMDRRHVLYPITPLRQFWSFSPFGGRDARLDVCGTIASISSSLWYWIWRHPQPNNALCRNQHATYDYPCLSHIPTRSWAKPHNPAGLHNRFGTYKRDRAWAYSNWIQRSFHAWHFVSS